MQGSQVYSSLREGDFNTKGCETVTIDCGIGGLAYGMPDHA
jgi:hypothetical protein